MKASASTMLISPKKKVALGAAGMGDRPWRGVTDDVELNAVLLQMDKELEPILLVSVDALYVGSELRRTIVESSGLPEDNVYTFASHSHRAPMIDGSKPLLGVPDSSHLTEVRATVSSRIKSLMRAPRNSAMLWSAKGKADHSINRRRRKAMALGRKPLFGKVVNAPNERGARDETIVTATFRDDQGTPLAVIWNYACHPVAGPHQNEVSAHYAGVVRDGIRDAEKRPELPVLFLQGFSGNTRPSASANARTFVRRVQRFLTGPVFEVMSPSIYESWSSDLKAVILETRKRESLVPVERIRTERQIVDSSEFFEPDGKSVNFARVSIGDNFEIIGVSAEMMAEYASIIRGHVLAEYVCCAGCMDDVFGYLPTAAIMAEGGYEGGGFCRDFGLTGMKTSAETAALRAFSQLMRPEKNDATRQTTTDDVAEVDSRARNKHA